jgi:hypothetical protein
MPAAIHRPGWKRRRNRLPTGPARCYRLGVETGTASCFNLLAADRQQRPSLARPTSPLKTRVRGFCRSASGRSSSRHQKTHAIATGSEPCGYKTASGRGKWPNRDPINDPGFQALPGFSSSPDIKSTAKLVVATLHSVDRLHPTQVSKKTLLFLSSSYIFCDNTPVIDFDRFGLQSSYWSCVGLVAKANALSLACLASMGVSAYACEAYLEVGDVGSFLRCVNGTGSACSKVCNAAGNAWAAAQANGCVPW